MADLDIYWKTSNTLQKMKFSIKNFFTKCDQIRSFLRIWSNLLKKSLMENLKSESHNNFRYLHSNVRNYNWINVVDIAVLKQPPEVLYKKRCYQNFCKIHRKTPFLQSTSVRLLLVVLQHWLIFFPLDPFVRTPHEKWEAALQIFS